MWFIIELPPFYQRTDFHTVRIEDNYPYIDVWLQEVQA
jgi:hypothetical protein